MCLFGIISFSFCRKLFVSIENCALSVAHLSQSSGSSCVHCLCSPFICQICVNCRQLMWTNWLPPPYGKASFVSVCNSFQHSFIPHKYVFLWPFLEQVKHFSGFLHILSKRSYHRSKTFLYLYVSRRCLFLNSLSSISLFWALFFTWVRLTVISKFLYIRRFFTLKKILLCKHAAHKFKKFWIQLELKRVSNCLVAPILCWNCG